MLSSSKNFESQVLRISGILHRSSSFHAVLHGSGEKGPFSKIDGSNMKGSLKGELKEIIEQVNICRFESGHTKPVSIMKFHRHNINLILHVFYLRSIHYPFIIRSSPNEAYGAIRSQIASSGSVRPLSGSVRDWQRADHIHWSRVPSRV